jgi:hypothetical protein
MTPFRTTFALLLVIAVLLLAAGCTSQSPATPATASPAATNPPVVPSTRPVTISTPVVTLTTEPITIPVTTITKETESVSQNTVAPVSTYHPEYIKMDATVYTPGEVVEFYLVNKGAEIKGCDYAHPTYTIYHLSPDGTRLEIAKNDPIRAYRTVMTADPASATGPFSLDTGKLSPGRYLIRFDCGNNVSRDFVIQPRSY